MVRISRLVFLALGRLALLLLVVTTIACSTTGLGGFGHYSQREISDYSAHCDKQITLASEIKAEMENLPGPYTISRVLKPFNQLEILVGDLYGRAQLYEAVQPNEQFREVASQCKQRTANLISDISLSQNLFKIISAVDISGANRETRRYVDITLSEFRLAGVDQNAETRNKVQKLNRELEQLEREFLRNIRDDVRYLSLFSADDLAGLPEDYVEAHQAGIDGRLTISTQYPDYIPFMTYAENDAHRESLSRLFQNRAWPANQQVLEQLLIKRHELAQLLGYQQYADYATANKMSASALQVERFIDELADYALEPAESEYQQLLARLKEMDPGASKVSAWQKSYLSELIKREKYALNSSELRQYFGYSATRDGIFSLVDRLFGLTVRPWETEVWHPSVEAYELLDGHRVIGRFYLDMHPRPGKYSHAAHFPVAAGAANRQLPVSALVANMPGEDDPEARMEHGDVVTFAHEFGHLLHRQLSSHYEWVALTGTEWDFVEAPSMMLEQWMWNPHFLQSFARNRQGEVIPDELVEQMDRARYFGRALYVQSQLYYSALSLAYHNYPPEQIQLDDLMYELGDQYTLFERIPDTHFYAAFGHLTGGYPGIYHTYMWSLAIALDMYSEFEREGLFDSRVADRYRRLILSSGGTRPANEMVEEFLGRPFNLEAFRAYLEGG